MALTKRQRETEIDRLASLSPEPENFSWEWLKELFARGDSDAHLKLHMDALEDEYRLDFTTLRTALSSVN